MILHRRRRHLSTTQRYLVLGFLSLCLGTSYALVLWRTHASAASSGEDSPVAPDSDITFSKVAPFTLTDSAGKTVTRDTLLGKPWIVDFVFTRCTGPCPVVTSFMVKAQNMLKDDDVRLVTITVDPEYDTPEVLAQYAQLIHADTQRWTFLTGSLEAITELLNTSFMVPIVKEAGLPVGQSIVHRTSLTVVDARGVVRGWYDGEHVEGVEQAVARARWLAQHPDASAPR